MKIKLYQRNSIAFKLAMAFIGAVLIQCLLMSATLILGGVLQQAEENAFQSFEEKVKSRKMYLDGEIQNVWINFSQHVEMINRRFENYQPDNMNTANADAFFEAVVPHLINTLRSSKTTGVFLILDDNLPNEQTYSALYIRDINPNSNSADNSDLSIVTGPWNVARKTKIPTTPNWRFRLTLDKENNSFYRKPYESSILSKEESFVGYWSLPFHLPNDNTQIITYSIPLVDKNGNLRGVFGIEISLEYLYRFLPASELQPKNSLGYIIGIKQPNKQGIMPLISKSNLQSRVLRLDEPLSLTPISENSAVQILNNTNSSETIYAATKQLDLYYSNTPFQHEEWYLIGLMEKPVLLELINKIKNILLISILTCLVFGTVVGIIMSRWFTKPIVDLAYQVQKNELSETQKLNRTGLAEIDALATAFEVAQKRLIESSGKLSSIIEMTHLPFGAFEIRDDYPTVFVTKRLAGLFNISVEEMQEWCSDKILFQEKLAQISQETWETPDVFSRTINNTNHWLRMSRTRTNYGVLGSVIDVTEEINETIKIKNERDKDGLTDLWNHTAFKKIVQRILARGDLDVAALIMFDMDNLKIVNDSLGHQMGDKYILHLSKCLNVFIDAGGIACRRSGDEFYVFIEGCQSREEIKALLKQFYALLNEEKFYQENNILEHISISSGIAWYDHKISNTYNLLAEHADIAMYSVKKSLKGSYCEYAEVPKNM